MMRDRVLLLLSVGCIAVADPTHRQDGDTPGPVPRPNITKSSTSLLMPQKLNYFHLCMEYAALDLCGIDPYAKTDVWDIQPSSPASVRFSPRAIYTGLFYRGILLKEWTRQEHLALLGIGNLSDDDKRAIGELLYREQQANTINTPSMTSTRTSIPTEAREQMTALENWDRLRRSSLTTVSGATMAPTPTTAPTPQELETKEKAGIFLIMSSALPQVFGRLDKGRNDAEKGWLPKSGMSVENVLDSPFVGSPMALAMWLDVEMVETLALQSSARSLGAAGCWGCGRLFGG
ncbi:hypothetical protein B0T21DRAFT_429366 [Apiosordaria backusii]|uniref:Uncharacterized protein n=1 Tax=Apiosordaria backusii TaxID=314023 RepID=A0AA40ESH0_9PEZI|nr:hypothetical protein B0T21DRAFT_429366 [Apiosordaria backusii]